MLRYIKNIIHYLIALFSALRYGFPGRKLIVIGITGTDGKTTTTHLVYHILKCAKKKVSMISTVSAIINNKKIDTGYHVTQPSPIMLQKLLKESRDGGSEYVVLELTSHGLDQHRNIGTKISIAAITNISHEHLDYHKTFKNYRDAKAKIIKKAKCCILNIDDSNYHYLSQKVDSKLITFGIDKKADFTLKTFVLKPKIPGKFNLYNCLLAGAITSFIGIPKKTIERATASFPGVSGRMEEYRSDNPFKIFIDFAHKPNALQQALLTARTLTSKKLIIIFGCAGLRDKLKRPMMGEIAANLADYIILTAEDPRTEDVRNISTEIALGCKKVKIKEADKRDKMMKFRRTNEKYYWKISDRQEAINFAIKYLAKKDDLILICGKGHEQSMCYGKKEYPWDEKKAIQKAIYATI